MASGVQAVLCRLGWRIQVAADAPHAFLARPPAGPSQVWCLIYRAPEFSAPNTFPAPPRPRDADQVVIIADPSAPAWAVLQRDPLGGQMSCVEYSPCCYGAPETQVVRVASTVSGFSVLQATCHHSHHSECRTGCGSAHEALGVAIAIARAVAGSHLLFPPAEEVGYRLGVQGFEAASMGWPALDSLLFRWTGTPLRQTGLKERVATSDLEGWLAARAALTPRVASVSQVAEWAPTHLYIGRACPRLQLAASCWANPFKAAGPNRQYSPEEAVRRYEEYVRASPELVKRLPELSGKVLVCHCRTDAPCHRSVLLALFEEKVRRPVEDGLVYIGQSHLRRRYRRTQWASPYRVGVAGKADFCVLAYSRDAPCVSRLAAEGATLRGKTVVCECARGEPCHADALQAALTSSWVLEGPPPVYIGGVLVPVEVQVERLRAEAVASAQWGPALDRAYRSLFPQEMLLAVQLPDLGEFYAKEPFTLYRQFLLARGLDGFGAMAPVIVSELSKGVRRASEGTQGSHFFAKGAVEQVVSLQLSEEEHFEAALAWANEGEFPMDTALAVDEDIRMVAANLVECAEVLVPARKLWFRGVVELARLLQSTSEHLRSFQHQDVASVAGKVHVALVAAAVVLCAWPDVALPLRYIQGFKCLGNLEPTGVLRPLQAGELLTVDQLLSQAHEVVAETEKPPRGKPEEAAFLLQECVKDHNRGFGGPLRSKQELDREFGPGKWVPMPRFLHIQANGKWRPIDDGRRYSHNQATRYTETLDCVTAVQPGLHVRALCRAAQRKAGESAGSVQEAFEAIGLGGVGVRTGTEDMPDAYRYVPCHPEEAPFNVVAVWDHQLGQARYQVVHGHVFGRGAAVVNFHRMQRLVNALGKRWLVLLMSFYFDDASIQDLSVCGMIGQRHLRGLMELFGLPLAPKKAVDMSESADYLGLVHSVGEALVTGQVTFQPRPKLVDKVGGMIRDALSKGSLTPAEASKLRGVLGFVATAWYGQIGRGGAHALIRRQYSDTAPFRIHPKLKRSLEYYLQLLQLSLDRAVRVWGSRDPPIVIATDGRVDASAPASIAYVVVDPMLGTRRAGWAWVQPNVKAQWGLEDGIALVEQAAILLAIQYEAGAWRGRDVIWFVDNSVALSAMTKGSSNSVAIDEAAVSLQLLCARLRLRIWWEYIESKSNWADKLSRERDDAWLRSQGFSIQACALGEWPWATTAEDRWAWVCAHESALGSAMG